MPAAVSSQGSPANAIVPESGLSSPARHRRMVVFPEPDGPKSTVTERPYAGTTSSAETRTRSEKRFSNRATSSLTGGRSWMDGGAARESGHDREHRERDEDEKEGAPARGRVVER